MSIDLHADFINLLYQFVYLINKKSIQNSLHKIDIQQVTNTNITKIEEKKTTLNTTNKNESK